jgi:hypothetical protein
MDKCCGLDVHKDSLFACILDAGLAGFAIGFFSKVGQSVFYQTATRS